MMRGSSASYGVCDPCEVQMLLVSVESDQTAARYLTFQPTSAPKSSATSTNNAMKEFQVKFARE